MKISTRHKSRKIKINETRQNKLLRFDDTLLTESVNN